MIWVKLRKRLDRRLESNVWTQKGGKLISHIYGEVKLKTHCRDRNQFPLYKPNSILINSLFILPCPLHRPICIHGGKAVQQIVTIPADIDERGLSRGKMLFPSYL